MEELTTALSLQEQEQIITALTSLTSAARKLDESQEFIPSSAARKQRLDG
jgi:hypothetical protein